MSEVMKFEIASKQGVILETEGRYCPNNIEVVPRLSPLTATKNGTYEVPDGHAGHGDVVVDLALKSLTTSEGGTYIAADEGVAGYDTVTFEPKLFDMEVNDNGTYEVPDGYTGYGTVTVNVSPVLTLELTGTSGRDWVYTFEELGWAYDPETMKNTLHYLHGYNGGSSHSVDIDYDDETVTLDSMARGTHRITLIDEPNCRIVARFVIHIPN